MKKKLLWIGLTLSLLALIPASAATASDWNKKTTLTFSQPVEIPGQILPAGTYVFKLVNLLSDRHIVQVLNADETKIFATILTLSDYRLVPTGDTVIKFLEVPAGSPEALRAWFYPGNTIGEEFVYLKPRAMALAMASKAVVPAIPAEATTAEQMAKAPIVAITPEQKETPVSASIQTTPPATVAQADTSRRELPKTASELPLIVLLGLGSLGAAFGLMAFGRRTTDSAR
jgi:hypothetical protein